MAKIYYVGDWAVLSGPSFMETPFQKSIKGLEIFNYGEWLKNAIESSGEHTVNSVPSWDFYKLPPGEYEEVLDEYDIFIFSDVEAKLFQLAPGFFDRERFGKEILTFPDRVRLTVDAVKSGKSAMFLGGWYSFTGEIGKGGWGRTALADILPVQCLNYEDLIESTEGFYPSETETFRGYFESLRMDTFPPILGYNETISLPESEDLLLIKGTDHPLLSIRKVGSGLTLAYTSDPAPHWGCNFVFWDHYEEFWLKCVDMLTSK